MAQRVADDMTVRINGSEPLLLNSYSINNDLFTVNSANFTIGAPGTFKRFTEIFPLGSIYEISYLGTQIQSGLIRQVSRSSGENIISMSGSDLLQDFLGAEVENEQYLKEHNYKRLVEKALAASGIEEVPVLVSGKDSRERVVGPVPTTEPVSKDKGALMPPGERVIPDTIKLSVGESWMDVIASQLRRSGLFIWTTPMGGKRGSLVIGQPDVRQSPAYHLRRISGDQSSNILMDAFSNGIEGRYSDYRVYGRNSGSKDGIGKVSARVTDEEMVLFLNQSPGDIDKDGKPKKKRSKTVRDNKIINEFQARCLCQRLMCDDRRDAFSLSYSIAGHSLQNSNGNDVLVIPDTMIGVRDDELGITGDLYVRAVSYNGDPDSTTTQIELWRTEDIWIEPYEPRPKPKSKPVPGTAIQIGNYYAQMYKYSVTDKSPENAFREYVLQISDPFKFIDDANKADATYVNPELDNAETRRRTGELAGQNRRPNDPLSTTNPNGGNEGAPSF
jgi:prophage tail gpP-like protein